MNIQNVAVSEVKTNLKWIRIDSDVEGLTESLEKIGLINPIIINKDFELLAGGRRLTAARSLGWKTILAKVVSTSDIENEIISLDENLEREDFKGIEWEDAIARRKELYEILHPETKKGGDKGNQYTGGKTPSCRLATFVEDTARKTGESKRNIERVIKRANESSEKVKQARKDLRIGSAHADALIKLPKKEQDALLPYIEKVPWTVANEIVERVKETSLKQVLSEQEQIKEAMRVFSSIKQHGNPLANTFKLAIKSKMIFYGKEMFEIHKVMAGVLDYGNQFMDLQKRRK